MLVTTQRCDLILCIVESLAETDLGLFNITIYIYIYIPIYIALGSTNKIQYQNIFQIYYGLSVDFTTLISALYRLAPFVWLICSQKGH